jgi:glycosyltransferase involved in cell wall biosynthesis
MGTELFDSLDAPAEIEQFFRDPPISHLMLMIWHSRKDLQNSFKLDTKTGQEAFINWYIATQLSSRKSHLMKVRIWLAKQSQCLPVGVRNKLKRIWCKLMVKAARVAVDQTDIRQMQVLRNDTNSSSTFYEGLPGTNLIGYPYAESGMGEHIRMTTASLSKTDVPFGVVDFGFTVSRQQASLDQRFLINTNKHKANIFHVNADHMLLAYANLGRKFFERRYNIGYPFWELSKFPQAWIPPMQLLDEVWAPTTFIQRALEEALGKVVPYMPVSVVLPTVPKLGREHFGLPADQYIFFFAFDCYSFIDRKNPYAVVSAFKKAFPLGNEKAGLVMKAMNAKENSETWQKLVRDIGGDNRIRLINKTMDKLELLSFKSECDCYISLHRAEGLGLGPLESMLLCKPVILTNYSGSADYANEDNSCLVDYKLIPVQEGQYVFHENQVWADPDVDHAAWHMQRLANDPELGVALGKKAAANIADKYSPARCGQLYKQRLHELGML